MQMFSVRLAALRKECGLSQDDLAKIINKTRSAVSGYEIEDKEPSFELLCALAKYFNVSTDYLLGLSDERRHVEQVFYNDQRNFEEHFKRMPAEMRPIIAQCFDSFYLLLGRDMQFFRPERLRVYQEFFRVLQSLRANVRNTVDASGGAITDALALSNVMSAQNQLKNEICVLLDKLMQADMEIAFSLKRTTGGSLPGKSAM